MGKSLLICHRACHQSICHISPIDFSACSKDRGCRSLAPLPAQGPTSWYTYLWGRNRRTISMYWRKEDALPQLQSNLPTHQSSIRRHCLSASLRNSMPRISNLVSNPVQRSMQLSFGHDSPCTLYSLAHASLHQPVVSQSYHPSNIGLRPCQATNYTLFGHRFRSCWKLYSHGAWTSIDRNLLQKSHWQTLGHYVICPMLLYTRILFSWKGFHSLSKAKVWKNDFSHKLIDLKFHTCESISI